MSFRKTLPNRFKVSDTPIPYSESIGGEIKEEYGINYIIFQHYNELMDLMNGMDEKIKAIQNEKCDGCKYKQCIKMMQSL